MNEPVSMELEGFKALEAVLKSAPATFQVQVAKMLNDLAFKWRPVSVTHLASRYIMRSPKFVLSRMRVEKTQPVAIELQRAMVGSTFVRGKTGEITFDGFARIAGHDIGGRTRTLALSARGGEKTAKAKPAGKLMPGAEIPKPDDWDDVQMPQSRVQAMIRAIASSNVYGKKFIIPKGNRFAPGLYRIKNKRGYTFSDGRTAPTIQLLQHFDRAPHAHAWNWLLESMMRTVQHAPLQAMWAQAMRATTRTH